MPSPQEPQLVLPVSNIAAVACQSTPSAPRRRSLECTAANLLPPRRLRQNDRLSRAKLLARPWLSTFRCARQRQSLGTLPRRYIRAILLNYAERLVAVLRFRSPSVSRRANSFWLVVNLAL